MIQYINLTQMCEHRPTGEDNHEAIPIQESY